MLWMVEGCDQKHACNMIAWWYYHGVIVKFQLD
jgi:hypothetical protein